ncbi:hypothetical protein SAMN02745111_00707 [Eubacterium uniforme]|uniref:Uncharacterized protein n=1 Tax=Eubacterium uniforme TaxID=39495 RepID=A0A1T4VE66_9FIRM|nr:DUF5677 domain-containing protein [Eubacterium uniforme]SKA62821.1 hypothetical protein SAMN02745111_00707 [Eubacterium uniforme]
MGFIKLSSYEFKKGKFISPWNKWANELDENKSWTYGRLPEYIWIALIFKYYGRRVALDKLRAIIDSISNSTLLMYIRMSDFITANEDDKKKIYQILLDNVDSECLAPLTVVITGMVDSVFASYFSNKQSVESRVEKIQECLRDNMWSQSDAVTDIRYVVLSFSIIKGRVKLSANDINMLQKYSYLEHDKVEMNYIRSCIRSSEIMLLAYETVGDDYIDLFWKSISELTECENYIMSYKEEKNNTKKYYSLVKDIFIYLQEIYTLRAPLDNKMKVLIGIATYSFKRLEEAEKHSLYNSISGRSIIRNMIENYIMMLYLSKKEEEKENIWKDFEEYGIGQYKLILTKHRDNENNRDSHVDEKILELLVNEYKAEEFQNMDTNYFNRDNVRKKAEIVDEKELYGLYYDYDSAYEHGLWGAIRECAMKKCNNPSHLYHCVPMVDCESNLKSVFGDCVFVMNKTIKFLNDVYGIPETMMKELEDYERSIFEE